MNHFRIFKSMIYTLKRVYGTQVYIYRPVTDISNVETGRITRTFSENKIKKAVVLPKNQTWDFIYDLAYVAASKNFTYGGFFAQSDTIVILDKNDISFVPDLHDHFEFKGKRYEITGVETLHEGSAYLVGLKGVDGELVGIVRSLSSAITFSSGVSSTL